MFRIDKRLVQVAQPAEIPLIPVPLPGGAPETAVSISEEVAAANMEAASVPGSAAQTEAQRSQLIQEARQQAKLLLREAEQQAAAKLKEAGEQAEAIRADAWQAGLEEGKNEALRAQAEQLRAAEQQINGLLTEIAAARDEYFHSYESELIDLVLAIAGKIAHTVIQQDGSALEAMIVHALKHMRREGKITIRVSEEMYHTFFNAESAHYVLGDESVTVALESDPLLGEGGLILESDGETVNAGVDSQLKYITLAFGRQWESD